TSPEKEYLIDFFLSQEINSIFMGVGGSFDVLSGVLKRAPLWMQRSGLEWLFRVIQEPRRLFKRYLFGNSIFVYKVLKEKVNSLVG
ncbi:WecB/TagA/CpsF family glycosyltransferase, partial [Enterococcus faecalis]|uniref:WecB/TagA/CpsF family glycosyltransferase n=1 Tax=Enterococcus faecalis TaxID=1351 RepID=UPI003D6A5118